MLEHYFSKPDTIDRIRSSWIAKPIEQYVVWLSENDYSFRCVYRRVPILRQFGEFAQSHGAASWDELPSHIEPFLQQWISERAEYSKQQSRRLARELRNPVEQMLSLILPDFQGLGRSRYTQDPFKDQAPGFYAFLREERGLRESSILHYGHHLRCLEAYLKRISLSHLDELSPTVISAFIIESSNRLGKHSISGLCCSLRVFLRYLHRERLVHRDLSATVESPRMYQLSDVPRSISWEEVQRMFDAVDRRTVVGRRDYAILLLLVTYGLRAHEVAKLTLDHIDWKRERLLVPLRKAGHTTAYPLSPVVGDAIVEYLEHGRPQAGDRHVFFRVMAPRVPLSSQSIANQTGRYLRKAGIKVHRPGSHTLRHTCVQRLVDAEFSFKVIGDYVGHASPSSTKIYTKIDVEALRDVALGHGEALS